MQELLAQLQAGMTALRQKWEEALKGVNGKLLALREILQKYGRTYPCNGMSHARDAQYSPQHELFLFFTTVRYGITHAPGFRGLRV